MHDAGSEGPQPGAETALAASMLRVDGEEILAQVRLLEEAAALQPQALFAAVDQIIVRLQARHHALARVLGADWAKPPGGEDNDWMERELADLVSDDALLASKLALLREALSGAFKRELALLGLVWTTRA